MHELLYLCITIQPSINSPYYITNIVLNIALLCILTGTNFHPSYIPLDSVTHKGTVHDPLYIYNHKMNFDVENVNTLILTLWYMLWCWIEVTDCCPHVWCTVAMATTHLFDSSLHSLFFTFSYNTIVDNKNDLCCSKHFSVQKDMTCKSYICGY